MSGGAGGHRIGVTRRARFSAARRLGPGHDEEGLHGHDFVLFVSLAGEVGGSSGMVMDLKALSNLIRSEVVSSLERRLLNDVAWLEGVPPTTENLAVAIWRRLAPRLPEGALAEVRLEEAGRVAFYRGT